MRCSGKVAIVTGGAMGIGYAIAQALLAEGAKVVIADREGAEEAALALDNARDSVIGVACDVSSQGDTEAMANAALEAFGRIDVLVNNAGIYSSLELKPFEELDTGEWRRVLDVNVIGQAMATGAVVPAMRRQGGGSIVNLSSGTPFKGVPFMLHYVASKGAVNAMTKALAKELGAHDIRVNAVAPGFTLSDGVLANPHQLETAAGHLAAGPRDPARPASGRHRGRGDLLRIAGLGLRHGTDARRRRWRLLPLTAHGPATGFAVPWTATAAVFIMCTCGACGRTRRRRAGRCLNVAARRFRFRFSDRAGGRGRFRRLQGGHAPARGGRHHRDHVHRRAAHRAHRHRSLLAERGAADVARLRQPRGGRARPDAAKPGLLRQLAGRAACRPGRAVLVFFRTGGRALLKRATGARSPLVRRC